jgi:hypothetical protein
MLRLSDTGLTTTVGPGTMPPVRVSVMTTSAFLAGWAAAVILGLYAFHCFWEARRADLVEVSRGHVPAGACSRALARQGCTPAGYRARACLALGIAAALAVGVLLLAR